MRITTIAEARELVGRTFERDGNRRTVVKVDDFGNVFWKRPEAKAARKTPQWLPYFIEWLDKATEATDG